MPSSMRKRRQRAAYRKGMLRAAVTGLAILAVMAVLSFLAIQGRRQAVEQRSVAEQQRDRADQNAQLMEKASKAADQQRREAVSQQRIAEEQRGIAVEQRDLARRQEEVNRRLLYTARSSLIQDAWEANDLDRMSELLQLQAPGQSQSDLRGFEWHYWQRQLSMELRILRPPANVLRSPYKVFSPDGRRMASDATENKAMAIKVFDTATGREILSFQPGFWDKGGGGPVGQYAFSPDGNRLTATVTQLGRGKVPTEGRLWVWDTATGEPLLAVKGLPSRITDDAPAISPDNLRVAAAYSAGQGQTDIRQWDIASGKELPAIKGLQGRARLTVFSPDDKRLAAVITGTSEKAPESIVKVWNLANLAEELTVRANVDITRLSFSLDGKRLVGSAPDLVVWDADGKEIFTVKGSPPIARTVLSPDGERLACLDNVSVITLRDAASGRPQLTLKVGYDDGILAVSFSSDGSTLYSVDTGGTVRVWDATASDQPLRLSGRSPQDVIVSPDGTRVAAAVPESSKDGRSNKVQVWDLSGRSLFAVDERISFTTQSISGPHIALSSDGRRIAYCWAATGVYGEEGHSEAVLKVWDVATGKELLAIKNEKSFGDVALSPDGSRLAYVAIDQPPPSSVKSTRLIKVVDAANGRELLRISSPENRIGTEVRFSPNGRYIGSAGTGATSSILTVWDAATGREVLVFKNPPELYSPPCLVFSPDSTRLAVSTFLDRRRDVRVYEISTGKELLILRGYPGRIRSLNFGPEGRRIVAGGATTKIWDTLTGQDVLNLTGHYELSANAVSFTPDGRRLITAGGTEGQGCEVRVWDATPRPPQIR